MWLKDQCSTYFPLSPSHRRLWTVKSFMTCTNLRQLVQAFFWSAGFGNQLCSQVAWVWIPALPLTSCVSLVKLPNFSVPLGLPDGIWEETGLTGADGFLRGLFQRIRRDHSLIRPNCPGICSLPCTPGHEGWCSPSWSSSVFEDPWPWTVQQPIFTLRGWAARFPQSLSRRSTSLSLYLWGLVSGL